MIRRLMPVLQTSGAYLDIRWEWAGPLFFAVIGVGSSIHTGDALYYSSPATRRWARACCSTFRWNSASR
jgi:hypothetical protein